MPTQTWKVVVTKLSGGAVLGEVEVIATNWMGALRAGRERLGEPAALPAGASCNVDSDGVATVLDPSSRRKLVLSPMGMVGPTNPPAAEAAPAPAAPTPAAQTATSAPVAESDAAPAKKKKRFETVAFMPGQLDKGPAVNAGAVKAGAPAPAAAPTAEPVAAAPAPAPQPPPQAPEPAAHAAPAPRADSSRAITPANMSTAPVALDVLFERVEDPSESNPICYRERAYYLPRSVSVQEAEACLRFELAALQATLTDRARGQLINLAVFDHAWSEAPERPPVVALQWRDWRGDVVVDYPAIRRASMPPPATATTAGPRVASDAPPAHDDRLDEVFEGLADLARFKTPIDGLDLAVRLLAKTVASEALAACLYDINTDELRFVSVAGAGAASRQGKAVARSAGLTGQALRDEHRPTVYRDMLLEPAFSPEVDGPAELDARNMLVCPVVNEGHLLGALQLVNRSGASTFSQADANVVGYLAERLGEFLRSVRQSQGSEPPRSVRRTTV